MTLGPGGVAVHKFGLNADVDIATVPEDVWSAGGTYSFPSAAATTTIVSSSANDDATGTGARTVLVQGLDSDWMLASETATMDGTNAVTLTTEFLRVFRAYVVTAGTGETNAGTISVKHGATVIAEIPVLDYAVGQTEMAIYTIPADYARAYITRWRVALADNTNQVGIIVRLDTRVDGGAWRTQSVVAANNGGNSDTTETFGDALLLAPKTDIRARVASSDSDNIKIVATFDVVLYE